MGHLCRIFAARLGLSAYALCAYGVGSFGQIAPCGTSFLCNPLRYGQQAAGLRVVCSRIAQQQGFACAAKQRLGNGLRSSAGLGVCRYACGIGYKGGCWQVFGSGNGCGNAG